MAAAHRGAHPREADGHRRRHRMAALSTDVDERRRASGPTFAAHNGKNGRLSVQTDPRFYRNAAGHRATSRALRRIAPNIMVKIPATARGVGDRSGHGRGISINATVCFTLSQCVAVAEAIERGLERRERRRPRHLDDGSGVHDHGRPSRRLAESGDGQGRHHHGSRASRMGRRRGVQEDLSPLPGSRLSRCVCSSAAFRNHMHWSELIGGDVVISPPPAWQKRFVASDVQVVSRIDTPSIPRLSTISIGASPISGARTTSWACRSTSSTAIAPTQAHAASVPRPRAMISRADSRVMLPDPDEA